MASEDVARGAWWWVWKQVYRVWNFVRWLAVPGALFVILMGATGAAQMTPAVSVQLVVGGALMTALTVYANLNWQWCVRVAWHYRRGAADPALRSLWAMKFTHGTDPDPVEDWLGVDLLFTTRKGLRQDTEWTGLRAAVLKASTAARGQLLGVAILLALVIAVIVVAPDDRLNDVQEVGIIASGTVVLFLLFTGGIALLRDAPTQRAEFAQWIQDHPRKEPEEQPEERPARWTGSSTRRPRRRRN